MSQDQLQINQKIKQLNKTDLKIFTSWMTSRLSTLVNDVTIREKY
jgi:hypothetical protein